MKQPATLAELGSACYINDGSGRVAVEDLPYNRSTEDAISDKL